MDRRITKITAAVAHRLVIKSIRNRISQSKRQHKTLMTLIRNKYRLLATRYQPSKTNISHPKKKTNG